MEILFNLISYSFIYCYKC